MPVLAVAAALIVAACGSDTRALPAVPQSAVPEAEATVGERAVVSMTEEACLRSGGQTLVFIDGQAELVEVDSHQRLELRSTGDDGTGSLASVPIDGAEAAPIGHAVQPDEWAEQPADGCHGPYFLVVSFEPPSP